MVKFNVEFLEDDAANPILVAGAATVTKEAKYCKWSVPDMVEYQLEFYTAPRTLSMRAFYKARLVGTNIPEKTFGTYWKASGLKALLETNTDLAIAKIALESYVTRSKKNTTKRTTSASKSHRYLTEQEEETIVHMSLAIGKAGRGVDRDELLEIINEVVNLNVDERARGEATEKVVREILERHPDLMKLVNAGSLDPLRAKKANSKTRDTVFAKLQAQTRGLYSEGKIPWENYRDIPSTCIYNMDEVGTDTTKHRRKVVADKRNIFQRIFTITPEGDRMKGHITACITTRADGEFESFYSFILHSILRVLMRLIVVCWLLTFLFVLLFSRKIP
jgi:hypothetical protein